MIYRFFAALILGALLPLAFAPWQCSLLAILIPCGLIFLWHYSRSILEAMGIGFAFGLTFFATGVYWIYYSIYTYGHSPLWLAYLIMILLCVVLALFPAFLGLLLRSTVVPLWLRWLCVYPSLWVLLEGVRAIIGSGFPWLSLGYSQTNTPLAGLAPFIGVYGLSWLCVFMGGLLFMAYQNKRWPLRIILLGTIGLLYGLGYGGKHIPWGGSKPPALSVALVQGNVTQDLKWDPLRLGKNLEHYLQLTQNHLDTDLIIWPEAAIPAEINDIIPTLDHMDAVLKKHHTNLLTGIIDNDVNNHYYNALILLGQGEGVYRKRHLVPFGEYLPLQRWLSALLQYWQLPNASLSAGPKTPTALMVNGVNVAPFICYEIIFPGLVRKSLPAAELLVTISDDAWFGDSPALSQHLQMAQMRSIEMARPQLFVSNSGITAIVDHKGEIQKRLPIDDAIVLTGNVIPHQGMTPFIYYGSWPVWIVSVLCLLLALGRWHWNKKTNR
ncbi:MAG: lnt [Gammaproteobacteria bacterium]|jgi:apolipoprotein N-acyltransferase|nr:lnt [Gammaproteobacteria bacterium]